MQCVDVGTKNEYEDELTKICRWNRNGSKSNSEEWNLKTKYHDQLDHCENPQNTKNRI